MLLNVSKKLLRIEICCDSMKIRGRKEIVPAPCITISPPSYVKGESWGEHWRSIVVLFRGKK
jgi:hypothetical protein